MRDDFSQDTYGFNDTPEGGCVADGPYYATCGARNSIESMAAFGEDLMKVVEQWAIEESLEKQVSITINGKQYNISEDKYKK